MTKKRRAGLAIGLAAACSAVLCAAGACNGIAKEEKIVHPAVITSTTVITTTNNLPTMKTPATTTVLITTTPEITTTVTCVAAETTTAEQITAAGTTVLATTSHMTTAAPTVTTAPSSTESHHGQTSGDYIYINGFGWVFNEGGGGYGETNYDMYCNGNKIGYFG